MTETVRRDALRLTPGIYRMTKRQFAEAGAAVLLAGLCVWLLIEVRTYPSGSQYLPVGVLGLAILLCLAWLIALLRKGGPPVSAEEDAAIPAATPGSVKRLLVLAGLTGAYTVSIPWLGFYTATFLAIPVISGAIGYRNLPAMLLSSCVFTVVVYGIFKLFLAVPLPEELVVRLMGGL